MESAEKKRILYFDVLNILAIIAVLYLHCNGIYHTYENTRSWNLALFFQVICYWAVPVFIMLTGATLMNYHKKYDTKTYFKKRFFKILIPWFIWSIILYIYRYKSFNLILFIKDWGGGSIESVYWFFPLIIYLYCLIPVLSVLTEKKENEKILMGIAIVIFLCQSVLIPLTKVFHFSYPNILSYFNTQTPYIIFLILGYFLSQKKVSTKKRIFIYVLAILGVVLRLFYTKNMSFITGNLNKDLSTYTDFHSIFLAMAIFLFIKQINFDKIYLKLHIKNKWIANLSSCSYGVFLIHMPVMRALTHHLNLDIYSIEYQVFGAVFLYFICVIIIYGIKKIPYLKNIVP